MTESGDYILLLTGRPGGWASGRFREAAKKHGVKIRAADPSKAMLENSGDEMPIRFARRRISPPVSVIPRLGPGNYENGLAVIAQFEANGIPVCNSSHAIGLARDTYLSLLELRRNGLQVPRTARLLSLKDLKLARKIIPGPPWILKTFTGAMGIGTMLMHEVDQLEALGATLWALGQPILLQEYIRSAGDIASDIRVLVIGSEVIGGIKRSAASGEFRSNVHRGGIPEKYQLSGKEKKLALKAAKAIRLDIAGVDWIETSRGPVVLEVNATPGFQGFESATGIDVAGKIIKYAVKQ